MTPDEFEEFAETVEAASYSYAVCQWPERMKALMDFWKQHHIETTDLSSQRGQ